MKRITPRSGNAPRSVSPPAVDRQDVLRTGRERDHQVHLRAQPDIAARRRYRRIERQRPLDGPRNVHEQVERARRLRRRQPQLLQVPAPGCRCSCRGIRCTQAPRSDSDRTQPSAYRGCRPRYPPAPSVSAAGDWSAAHRRRAGSADASQRGVCSIDMNSVMSWRLNAQVSTTCSPCVLITRTTWPAAANAALPRRAGMVTSWSAIAGSPLPVATLAQTGPREQPNRRGELASGSSEPSTAITGTCRMQPVGTGLWRAIDHAITETRSNRADRDARIFMMRRQQPVHSAAAHRLAHTLQIRNCIGRRAIIDPKADHHPVGLLRC